MAPQRRDALRWRRKLFWRRLGLAIMTIVVLVIGLVTYNRVIRPSLSTPTSPATSQPSPSLSNSEDQSPEEEEPEQHPIDPVLQQLVVKVEAFEEAFRSFDSSNPSRREAILAEFMTPELLVEVTGVERDNVDLQEFISHQGIRKAVVNSPPIGEFVDEANRTAVFYAEVFVHSVQNNATPIDTPFASQTTWVLQEGKWLVSVVDPL